MNDFGRSALDRLHYQVVIIRLLEVHYLEEFSFHLVLERGLAKLALEGLPEEAAHIIAIVDKLLAIHPFSQAVDVDILHGARAFARSY